MGAEPRDSCGNESDDMESARRPTLCRLLAGDRGGRLTESELRFLKCDGGGGLGRLGSPL